MHCDWLREREAGEGGGQSGERWRWDVAATRGHATAKEGPRHPGDPSDPQMGVKSKVWGGVKIGL